MKSKIDDKVRIKTGIYSGQRGVVESVDDEQLVVRLDDSSAVIRLQADQITNFSLAARKAWLTGPNRGVGRRKGTKIRDRVTVTFRIDRELWEEFTRLLAAGDIEDRNAVVNAWFREKLAERSDGGQEG